MTTMSPEFDHARDCGRYDTVQDVRITKHEGGTVSIEQQDGTNEYLHYVALPAHMVSAFADALHAVLNGAEPITISGLPSEG